MRIKYEGLKDASTSTKLPNGNYAFEIDAVDPNYESAEKHTKGIDISMHVIEGMNFEDGSSTVGLQRNLRLWLPHGGMKDGGKFCMGRINEFVKACGLDTSEDEFDTDDLIGTRFMCRSRLKAQDDGNENEDFDKFAAFA